MRQPSRSEWSHIQALFAELIDVFNERWKKESSALVGSKTGLEAFDAANESIIDFMNDNSDYIRAMFILYYETVGSSTVMRERLAEQHGAYRRAIARYIRVLPRTIGYSS